MTSASIPAGLAVVQFLASVRSGPTFLVVSATQVRRDDPESPLWLLVAAVGVAVSASAVWWIGVNRFFGVPAVRTAYARARRAIDAAMGDVLVCLTMAGPFAVVRPKLARREGVDYHTRSRFQEGRMFRWAIVIGAALIGGAATFLFFRTYMLFGPASALVCAAAVTIGLGVIAHLNTPDTEELEDSLE